MANTRTPTTAESLRGRAKKLLAGARAKDAAARKQERKSDSHRKIIVGGWALRAWGNDLEKMPLDLRAKLEREVVRPWDRAALGLPLLAASPNEV